MRPHDDSLGRRLRRPFQRGDFKYIILQHLKEKPRCGYEIIRAIEERFQSFYVPSPGSVYPTLQMLEEMSYVTSVEEEGKKVYSLTEEGGKFLEREKDPQERIRNQTKKWCNPENADDVVHTMHEFDKIGGLLRDKVRHADTEKLRHMREVLSRTYEELNRD